MTNSLYWNFTSCLVMRQQLSKLSSKCQLLYATHTWLEEDYENLTTLTSIQCVTTDSQVLPNGNIPLATKSFRAVLNPMTCMLTLRMLSTSLSHLMHGDSISHCSGKTKTCKMKWQYFVFLRVERCQMLFIFSFLNKVTDTSHNNMLHYKEWFLTIYL